MLCDYLARMGHLVFPWGRAESDLSLLATRSGIDALNRSLDVIAPDWIVHCAAMSGIEDCLDAPAMAHVVNSLAPGALAQWCSQNGADLLHLSTDYVLDGSHEGKKTEFSACAPINQYGYTKLEGEQRVLSALPCASVVRVSWVFGNPARPAFAEIILRKALAGEPLAGVDDKESMPTYLPDLCAWLHALMGVSADARAGVFHACQSGIPTTWFDYARLVVLNALAAGLPLKSYEVKPLWYANQKQFRDARPIFTAMDNTKLAQTLGISIPTYTEAIKEFCLGIALLCEKDSAKSEV